VDEALLTGESVPVARHAGDRLLSGSFCVAGVGAYRADRVGASAFVHSTAAEARAYRYIASPMQHAINRIVEVLTATAVVLSAAYVGLSLVRSDIDGAELARMIAATITSMVPQGLVLMATLAFLLGAVRMSRRGAVVQRLSAVESMAAVDVLCMDKTGTLTTSRLRLERLVPLGGASLEEVRQRLRLFTSASLDRDNKSLAALRDALGETSAELVDQIPFKSQNRYSAVRVRVEDCERVLALGAPEALGPRLEEGYGWQETRHELAKGLRLLLFAESAHCVPFHGTLDGFPLRPLALVALSDELRPEAPAVLEAFAEQGIRLKVLSGDHAETVRATVSHLKLPLAGEQVVSGDQLSGPNCQELCGSCSVFGRVSPRQKVEIVEALQRQGAHVAMIGDGVNDVLPIKRADLGIAMGEGSRAARTVAGLVLENNDFGLLPQTLEEGRTILRNLRRSSKLFLLKNVYTFVLIVGFMLLGGTFPYLPQQVTLLNLLTIGIPAFVITLSKERSTAATKTPFLREVGSFVFRSGLVIGVAGLILMAWARSVAPGEVKLQRTLLLSALVLLGITGLLRALTDGEAKPLRGDRRFRWLAGAAVPVYVGAMYGKPPARFFELAPLDLGQWGMVLAVVAPAYLLCKLSDWWVTNR
jgi:cation-transporting ATPase E